MVGLKRRSMEPIRVYHASFPEDAVFLDFLSLEELKSLGDKNHPVFEDADSSFVVDDNTVYRYLKPDAFPKVMKTEHLEVNPDSVSVKLELTQEQLFNFARKEQLLIFETADGWWIPSSICMYAKKGSMK